MIDFGLNDINIDLGLENTKKKTSKPVDPKDPFQMNDLAEGIKGDVQNTVNGIKSDIENLKKDYHSIKGEIIPIVDYLKNFKEKQKVKKELVNITAFSNTLRSKRIQKDEVPSSVKERYPLMSVETDGKSINKISKQ